MPRWFHRLEIIEESFLSIFWVFGHNSDARLLSEYYETQFIPSDLAFHFNITWPHKSFYSFHDQIPRNFRRFYIRILPLCDLWWTPRIVPVGTPSCYGEVPRAPTGCQTPLDKKKEGRKKSLKQSQPSYFVTIHHIAPERAIFRDALALSPGFKWPIHNKRNRKKQKATTKRMRCEVRRILFWSFPLLVSQSVPSPPRPSVRHERMFVFPLSTSYNQATWRNHRKASFAALIWYLYQNNFSFHTIRQFKLEEKILLVTNKDKSNDLRE